MINATKKTSMHPFRKKSVLTAGAAVVSLFLMVNGQLSPAFAANGGSGAAAATQKAGQEAPRQEFGSVEERRLISSVIEQRDKLRKEQEDVALRKKELKTLEEGVDNKLAEIDKKLEELKALQKKIESLLAAKSAEEQQKIKDLAVIYAKMTPDKAAMALAGVDEQLASDLMANMKVKAAAKIMDRMSQQKASELTKTFTTIQIE